MALHTKAARRLAAFVLLAASLAGCAQEDFGMLYDERLGGDTTAFSAGRNAFELSARNLTNEERRTFEVGDSFFTQNWVTAPASTDARDGLGPTFNALACSSCHSHDGRAKPPDNDDDPERGLLLRINVPGPGGPRPDPVYGGQLQDRAILGVPEEGRIRIRYEEMPGAYPDGAPYSLRKPTYTAADLSFGPLSPGAALSPRVAPAVIGMGLLEAIPEERVLALADPDDADGDGVSGRPNVVWDIRRGRDALGRFGWKAGQPSVEQQAAGAFHGDIGVTTSLFPDENCPAAQRACRAAPNGGEPEAPDDRLDRVVFYSQTLAVPAMRNADDPRTREGARLFADAGCAACHSPRRVTSAAHPVRPLRDQTIYPYTDLLLHDMGEGLADGFSEGAANGREWRTAPLWGIGLIDAVNDHMMLLHDGRARGIEEAILWHGGEAQAARDAFTMLSADERSALLHFLESL